MNLRVWTPTEILVTAAVAKVKAEAEDGWFGVLPRHVDFVTSLVPGVLTFESVDGETHYIAIDYGVLVKCGAELSVSTRNAVLGVDLGNLRETAEMHFRTLRDKHRAAQVLEASLEADLVRRLLEVEKHV